MKFDIGAKHEEFGNFDTEPLTLSTGFSLEEFILAISTQESLQSKRNTDKFVFNGWFTLTKIKLTYQSKKCSMLLFEVKDGEQLRLDNSNVSDNSEDCALYELRNSHNKGQDFLKMSLKIIEILWLKSTDLQKQLLSKLILVTNQLSFFAQTEYDLYFISQNQFSLKSQDFSLEEKLREILEILKEKIEEKRITYEITCEGQFPEKISQDSRRIQTILFNLLEFLLMYCKLD